MPGCWATAALPPGPATPCSHLRSPPSWCAQRQTTGPPPPPLTRSEAEQLDEEQLLRLQFSLRRLHKSAAWVRTRIRELKERRDAAATAGAASDGATTRPITLADLVRQLQVRGRRGAGGWAQPSPAQPTARSFCSMARPRTHTRSPPLAAPPTPPPPRQDCADKDDVVSELLGRYQARLAQLGPGELADLLAALGAGDARCVWPPLAAGACVARRGTGCAPAGRCGRCCGLARCPQRR
jgi:hypothetical protein